MIFILDISHTLAPLGKGSKTRLKEIVCKWGGGYPPLSANFFSVTLGKFRPLCGDGTPLSVKNRPKTVLFGQKNAFFCGFFLISSAMGIPLIFSVSF